MPESEPHWGPFWSLLPTNGYINIKVGFKAKKFPPGKERYYTLLKVSINQKGIIILNVYT